ncbi:DUF6634 family protein [Oryzibacter oryziterrae]|uniref:DUF6634 family protein n=1 Tax=Oryzibacter oryziterrae TaxID=2766474 RepID=UPI0036F1CA00
MIDIDNPTSLSGGGALDREIVRLERLLADLRHLRDRGEPDEVSLHVAPVLDGWSIAFASVPCLVGCVTGHPILAGAGRYIATSDLCVVSARGKWGRTRSRYYQLGSKSELTPRIVLS